MDSCATTCTDLDELFIYYFILSLGWLSIEPDQGQAIEL